MPNYNNLIPYDVMKYKIGEYMNDLIELDRRKRVLKILAEEAIPMFKDYLNEMVKWELEDIYNAQEYMAIAQEEKNHGPCGDRGNYLCYSFEDAESKYKESCIYWNKFVKECDGLKHLINVSKMRPINMDE